MHSLPLSLILDLDKWEATATKYCVYAIWTTLEQFHSTPHRVQEVMMFRCAKLLFNIHVCYINVDNWIFFEVMCIEKCTFNTFKTGTLGKMGLFDVKASEWAAPGRHAHVRTCSSVSARHTHTYSKSSKLVHIPTCPMPYSQAVILAISCGW